MIRHLKHTMNPKRLFAASFLTLIVGGVVFALRSSIITDWGRLYGFTQAELGSISGGGFTGFGLTIIFFSLLADRVGYGRLMGVAFALHVLSAVVTLAATAAFHSGGKQAAYWTLYAGQFLFALANGTCEAVINPLTATLYPKERTHYLNILHAGWPCGIIVGCLLSFALVGRTRWEIQLGLFLIPTLIYGALMLNQRFPESEAKAAGVSFGVMLKELVQPVLLVLFVMHALIGYVELGVDGWIANLMTAIAGMNGILVLLYTSCIMFVLRFCAGPIVHRLSPLGLLCVCALLACVGLVALGNAASGFAVIVAATIYGVGKTFFWPTMLGVVSERFPKGGALTMGTIAGIGMLSAGLLGAPGIGYVQDFYSSRQLSQEAPAVFARYAAPTKTSFLLFPATTGLDGTKVGELLAKPEAQLAGTERTDQPLVNAARIHGGRMSLKWTALLPAILAAGYLGLICYFRARGGYRQIHLAPADAGHSYSRNPVLARSNSADTQAL
jgi:MFS family permease